MPWPGKSCSVNNIINMWTVYTCITILVYNYGNNYTENHTSFTMHAAMTSLCISLWADWVYVWYKIFYVGQICYICNCWAANNLVIIIFYHGQLLLKTIVSPSLSVCLLSVQNFRSLSMLSISHESQLHNQAWHSFIVTYLESETYGRLEFQHITVDTGPP